MYLTCDKGYSNTLASLVNKIDCDVSFRLDVSGCPKGLYRTKTALKVFEVISILWN